MPHWFAPKRYGYGSGLPISWQGWAIFIGYLAAVIGSSFLAERSLIGWLSLVAVLTAAFVLVCARTTRGGWRWRWGEKD